MTSAGTGPPMIAATAITTLRKSPMIPGPIGYAFIIVPIVIAPKAMLRTIVRCRSDRVRNHGKARLRMNAIPSSTSPLIKIA